MPWCIAAESGQATGLADHRLDRGPGPASGRPGELRQVGHRGAEVQQPGDQAGVRVLPEDRLHRRQRPRRHQVDRRDELPDRRQRAVRQPARAATCSSRRRSSPARVASRTRCSPSLDTTVGVHAFPPKTDGRQPGPQSVATSPRRSTTTPTPSSCATSSPARRTESTPARPATSRRTSPSTSRCYPNKTLQKIAEGVLYKATAVRFDGSDLMPAKVGRGNVLDRAGQVDLGSAGPRHHAEQHRRQLPEGQ